MAFLIGKKLGMTQVFANDGTVTPVTVIHAEPISVTQLRTVEKDRYEAVQYVYGKNRKEHRIAAAETKVGDKVDVSAFTPGDIVKVTGNAKGKGFQGAVKRHGFAGSPASHGHHHVLRHPGSIGQRFPQHTLKGTRMAGRMGGKQITTRGLKVMSVDLEKNLLMLKGAVPGRKATWLTIVTI
ncbi:MAG: 50S ribosomal protein L3 [Patescibacteria group bacterium]